MRIYNFKKYKINLMIRKELKKNLIKFFLANKYNKFKSKKIINFIYRNQFFFKFSSISFFRRSCIVSGNCRSVSRHFKLSRYLCRYYASNGYLVGLRKASF